MTRDLLTLIAKRSFTRDESSTVWRLTELKGGHIVDHVVSSSYGLEADTFPGRPTI
jgi:hypothetical protein